MIKNLTKGVENGIYRENININFISRIYFTGLTGIKDSDIFPSVLFEMDDLTRQYLEYHLRAIVTPQGLAILEGFLSEKNN